jgi:hypothetical protein
MVPLLLGLAVLAALLTPEKANRDMGDRRLSTRETTPASGSLMAELPRALGWRVDENVSATVPPRPDMVHLVLAPSEPLRAPEVHALLERVRAGAGLFVVIKEDRDLLADSLHLGFGGTGPLPSLKAAAVSCTGSSVERLPWLATLARYQALTWDAPPPGPVDTLLRFANSDTTRNAVLMGFAYGRGRVVAGADPDLFRNDELRQCEQGYAPLYVSLLEYLRDSSATTPRRWLMFDEYHQGFGPQPGTVRAVVTFFSETTPGHVLAQLAVAALLLLLVRAPRLVPPPADATDERRSPIEHVDALARAYVQVGASKTATQRLVRGLRRRLERGTVRGVMSLSDEAFLERVATRTPALTAAVGTVRHALAHSTPPRDFSAVGDALARIEQTLRQESR